eukprot:TRINITY_DN64661_c0_g1_i1.p1 TRINITY_DN64661_c0_g1~~TRINITY_DN64661_c0_g1_i1.p1  ORF type:complete len:129 (-),score=8.80 TRINITY_DN64661_c0_g1_i1:52-438(-)
MEPKLHEDGRRLQEAEGERGVSENEQKPARRQAGQEGQGVPGGTTSNWVSVVLFWSITLSLTLCLSLSLSMSFELKCLPALFIDCGKSSRFSTFPSALRFFSFLCVIGMLITVLELMFVCVLVCVSVC